MNKELILSKAKKLKICMLLDNCYPPDYRPQRAIDALLECGHRIDLFAENGSNLPAASTRGDFRIFRALRPWETTFKKHGFSRSRVHRDFLSEIGTGDYDLIYCNDWLTLTFGAELKRLHGIPLIYDAHEYFAGYNPLQSGGMLRRGINFLKRQHRLADERRFGRIADHVITVSDEIGELLQRRFGRSEPPLIVRNIPDLHDSGEAVNFHDMLGLPVGKRFLIHSGNIRTKSRCLDKVLDAFVGLDDSIHLLFLGRGADQQDLEIRSRELGLHDRIHFLGAVPQEKMMPYLKGAHAGIALLDKNILNNRLALPNKFFEYIQAGLPQVCNDNPSQKKYAGEYSLGISVDSNRVEEIRAAINRIFSEYDYFRSGVERAKESFTWNEEKCKFKDFCGN